MRKKLIIVLTAMLAMAGITTPAHAAYTDCPKSYYCVWQYRNYTGKYFASEFNIANYATSSAVIRALENKGSSVYNNGTTMRIAAYINADRSGNWFYLNNAKKPSGAAVRDPNLSNGAGYNGKNAGANFDNKLSRHQWVKY